MGILCGDLKSMSLRYENGVHVYVRPKVDYHRYLTYTKYGGRTSVGSLNGKNARFILKCHPVSEALSL